MTGAKLQINSDVKNYTKGFIYINTTAVANTINIDNCLIHDIECNGGDFTITDEELQSKMFGDPRWY